MPYRPPRKSKKPARKHVPGCIKLLGKDAVAFLKDQLLLSTMEAKRARHLEGDEEETVMVSIGTLVRYNKTSYIAHVYCIDNFADPTVNGWILHLWHPKLVLGKHKTYQQYMTQMGSDLGIDLWSVGI